MCHKEKSFITPEKHDIGHHLGIDIKHVQPKTMDFNSDWDKQLWMDKGWSKKSGWPKSVKF